MADLGQSTPDAGMLLDDLPCLLDTARRLLREEFFQADAMVVEFAVAFLDGDLANQRQAASSYSDRTRCTVLREQPAKVAIRS